jgi:putative membrane protein
LEALDTLDNIDGIDAAIVTSLRNAVAGVSAIEEMAVDLIGESSDMIGTAPELIAAKYQLLKPILEKCEEKLKDMQDTYNTTVVKAINSLKNSLDVSTKGIIESLNSAGNSLSGVEKLLLGVSNIMLSANDSLGMANNTISGLKEKLAALSEKVDGIDDSEGYQVLLTLIEADAQMYASFLSEPVQVNQHDVYMATNYGTSVTPFYTTLAIWVGGIVLVAIMKVHVDYEDEEIKKATLSQKYFGRLLIFIVMGQIQAAVTVLGNIYILKIDCMHPVMMWVVAAVASLVFISFIYSLTLAFGDVGKAIAVVMVVIQIAGSSGTFPIELLPDFFQNVYRYFPFPYAINAMREAISGLYQWDYLIYLAQLMIYGIVALIIGLVIRKPFIKIGHFIEHKMKETKMM